MWKLLLAVTLMLCLSPLEARAEQSLFFSLGLGAAVPTGTFADGYEAGIMGDGSFGVMSGRMGARLYMGSAEPGTLARTNDAWSSLAGRPIEVSTAVVPVEVQGLYLIPLRASTLALRLQGGLGGASITTRVRGTDDRLSDDWRFGMSGGAGLILSRRSQGPTFGLGVHGVYRRVFDGSDSIDYITGGLEFSLSFN
jgi:hypothetical protein